jgi:hypothetical protein
MRHLKITAAFALIAALFGLSIALANPYNGNPWDWHIDPGVQLLLQQNLIGTLSTAGDPVDVCSAQFPTTANLAGQRWNTALSFTAFRYRSCDGWQDAEVVTTSDFDSICGAGWHACVHPTAPDWGGYNLGFAYVFMNPNGHGGVPWVDGDAHTTRDITHELGHVLGEGHVDCAVSGASVMSGSESCWYETPQSVDTNNYHLLYHADPVSNLYGWSPSAGTVNLTWSQTIRDDGRQIPNEKSFTIKRMVNGTPVTEKTVSKNSQSAQLTSQTPGSWEYRVYSDSDADNQPQSDRSYWPYTVNVTAPTMARPTNFTVNAYSSSQIKLTWSAVSGAASYERCLALNPSIPANDWICANVGNITSQTTSLPYPPSGSEAVYYLAVRAVDAYGVKGKLSNQGMVSGFNYSSYKSYHTIYKTSSTSKKVNAFNKRSSGSHYLGFWNGSVFKSGSVSAGQRWYNPGPSSWSASEYPTPYGPYVWSADSGDSDMDPREDAGINLACAYNPPSNCP